MAFNFGASSGGFSFGQSSAPAFGAASTPAATSAPLFGGFGAASTPASTPAFGASSGSLFGAASTPAFGASSSSLFGAASTPATSAAPSSLFGSTFGASSAAGSSFAFGSTPAFGQTGSSFAPASQASQSSSLFAPSTSTTSTWAGTQQQQSQPGHITYNTKWEELPAAFQQQLTQLQQVVSSYREDCDKLEKDTRLHDSVELKKSLHEETHALKQSLQGLLNAVKADDDAMCSFRERVMRLLHSSEAAVRTYQRAKLWREAPRGQMLPPQVQEQLAAPVVLPSPYLEMAIHAFQETLGECRRVVGDLEQAVPSTGLHRGADGGVLHGESLVQALPSIVSSLNTYLFHVAALLETLHAKVRASKEAFLRQRRAAGDFSDPFHNHSSRPLMTLTPASNGHSHMAGGAHSSSLVLAQR